MRSEPLKPETHAAAASFRHALALLATRRFGTFWVASLLSNIGTWAQQVAQPWLLLSIGATPFVIGLDEFALDAPGWLFTLIGGVLADRMDRRHVIARFQSIQMLCPVLVVVLLATGAVRPWMVIALSLVVGITDALSMPSFQTIVPTIVEQRQIPTALALTSTQFNASRIAGPAIAGVLITFVGIAGCYVVSALSYLPFILVALWALPRGAVAQDGRGFEWGALYRGFGPILRQRRLCAPILTVLATSVFCASLITFIPVLIKSGFHGTALQFSTVVAAFGVGGLAGAVLLLALGERRNGRLLTLGGATVFAVVVVFTALSPWLWSVPVLLGLAGLAMNIGNTSANAMLLQSAPAEHRGQTISLYMLAMRGGLALGGLVTGLTVSGLGVRHALLLNGVVALLALPCLALFWHGGAAQGGARYNPRPPKPETGD